MTAGNAEPRLGSGTHVERASDRELVIRRVFQAKPATLFDAMTQPDLLRRWWAPKGLGVQLYEVVSEPRVGGRYRFEFGHPGQPRMAFSGRYVEFVPGVRLAYSQIFEPMPNTGEGLITATFEPFEGGTLFVSRERYPSKEVLDGAISSGMERGMRETLEQLTALLAEIEP